MTTPRFHDGISLVATRSAIACARLFVASTLDKWCAGIIADEAVLVVDDLVTNAVTATGTMDEHPRWTDLTVPEFITVHLFGLDAHIRIEVWDSAPNPPALPAEDSSPVKRGSYPTARGKVVWTELPVFPRRSVSSTPIRPPPEELARHQTDPHLLRGVRDGLEDL